MPCTYYSPDEERELNQKELNKLTRLLCLAVKGKTSPELEKWKEEHRIMDEQRERDEAAARRRKAAKRIALAKLSPEDKKALGVKE